MACDWRPEQIDDRKPRWETFRDAKADAERLAEERVELHAYQDNLDTARERTKDPEFSKQELDALDTELRETAPARVSQKLGNDPQAPSGPYTSAEVDALERELGPSKAEITTPARRSGLTPG